MKIFPILLLFVVFLPNLSNAQLSKVLKQDNPPLQILSFDADYQKKSSYYSEGIKYSVTLKNATQQAIVAYKIAFQAFDAFNESLGRPLSGYAIEQINVGNTEKSTWVNNTYNASLFEKYGQGIAYVSTVRFIDGTIWKYDADNILTQLQEIEASFALEDLESEEN